MSSLYSHRFFVTPVVWLKAIVFFVCSIINAVRSYSNNFSYISVTIRSIFTRVIQIVGGIFS